MRYLLTSVLASTLLFTAGLAFAQESPSSGPKTEDGWFFFKDPKPKPPAEEAPAPPRPSLPSELPPPPKEDKCTKKESWSVDCGFVNPGADFQFQSKQRDALMERMSVAKNDPKAVEAFQYYMRWVLERTSEVTNLWWYNMVQNPDLDPNVQAPVSAFGMRLMTDVQKGKSSEIYNLIKNEGGFFIYFSRSDCNFCHQMRETMLRLSRKTGLEVRNASLDDKCIPGMESGCLTAPATMAPAAALQVATVPAVFLYVQPNTWLRIGTGVVDQASLETRTTQFFAAYRSALIRGVDNSDKGRPSVDFSTTDATGASAGVAGAKADGPVRLPTEEEIGKLLGAPAKR